MENQAHKHGGFTLFEVMVTLAIAAVALTVAIPGFFGVMRDTRITTTTNAFVQSLGLARSEAFKMGSPVTLVATAPTGDDEWSGGWTIFADDNGDGVQQGGERTIRVVDTASDELVLDDTGDNGAITYQPTGLHAGAPAARVFDVCYDRTGETGNRITIGPVGRADTSALECN